MGGHEQREPQVDAPVTSPCSTHPMPTKRDHARSMRKQPTDAEALLWRRLRGKQLGVRFRRQHPVAGYIVDFYCADARLVIELDGGGHAEAKQRDYDQRRSEVLERHGLRVLRLWNPEVVGSLEAVLEVIDGCVRGEPVPEGYASTRCSGS